MSKLKIKKLDKDAVTPKYETAQAAGMDLTYPYSAEILLKPNMRVIVSTGIAIELEVGYEAQIRPRSGLVAKNGITVLNSPGTIDADYRGEVKIILYNSSNINFIIQKGMRIAQMVVAKYEQPTIEEIEYLSETERGENGFGSTGVK